MRGTSLTREKRARKGESVRRLAKSQCVLTDLSFGNSDYDETELDELDTVVVDPLSSNSASGPTLNWGWGQPVRLQSREDTHNHNRAYRHHSHAMSLFRELRCDGF